MNFHSDQWINEHVKEHYKEAREHFPYDRILGCFYQGSGNYEMDYKDSDVDTKLIVLPTFKELAMGNQPLSTTHVRTNDEHIDFKDLRHYLQIFRKQNMNFLEILFTPYWFANDQYILEWKRLIDAREEIARYSVVRAVKAMQGVAKEKYFAMEHHYPSRMHVIEKLGYDCYTDDTKFLTKNGWKTYYDISDDEEIATFNPKTQQLEFQAFYQRFCNEYHGDVYDVETHNSHFSVTPNHKIYTSPIYDINTNGHRYNNEFAQWNLEPIQNILDTRYIKGKSKHRHLACVYNTRTDLTQYEDVNITDDLLKLIGAFASEGSICFKNNIVKDIRISQTSIDAVHNQSFIAMMDNINDFKLNKYVSTSRNNGQYDEIVWSLSDPIIRDKLYEWCGHGSRNKRLPPFIYDLSQRQANILLDSLCLGDGTDQTSRRVYYTTSKQLANDVQILSMMAEHYAVVMGGENGYKSKDHFGVNDLYTYQVAIKKEIYSPEWCYFKLDQNVKKQHYDGNVVCFSVPNSILITQKDGKLAVQGNCKQLHHLLRVAEFIERYIAGESYQNCLIPRNLEYLVEVKKGLHNIEEAREIGSNTIAKIDEMCKDFVSKNTETTNPKIDVLLDDVQYNILKIAITNEIN